MDIHFGQILIPVDFTINTQVAIGKALSLAEPGNSVLHLLHVRPVSLKNFLGYDVFSKDNGVKGSVRDENFITAKMQSLKTTIYQQRPDISVTTHTANNINIEAAIIKKALEIMPDIILLAKKSHHSLLPFLNTVVPTRIAQQTQIPVLTSKPGSIHHAIKTIVVPLGKKFPQKKIDIINALRRKSRLNIRLLSFREDEDSNQVPDILIHVYRLLRQGALSDIQYETVSGKNKAKAILTYCEKVDADLLIVTPESETKIGWLNKHISDVMPAASKTQVLAV